MTYLINDVKLKCEFCKGTKNVKYRVHLIDGYHVCCATCSLIYEKMEV